MWWSQKALIVYVRAVRLILCPLMRVIAREVFAAFYFASGGHHVGNGGLIIIGHYRVSVISSVGTAAGRLSNHSGHHLISWGKPGCYDCSHYFPLGAPAWSNGGFGANDFGQFSRDRKSTRLNSSHVSISYAVFC